MTSRNRLSAVFFCLLTSLTLLVPAARAAGVVEDRGTLRATVGGGQVLTFSSAVKRIAVADDKLASIHLVSDREVLINGTKPGVTTLFIWLEDDRRVRYVLRVGPNMDFVAQSLRELDPRISVDTSPDGETVVLRGDVADAKTARIAKQQAEELLSHGHAAGALRIINLLHFPGITASAEDRLQGLLETVDPRIHVRRIQVGTEPDPDKDSFVLEGNVRTVEDLQRAIALAERQLGGTGVGVKVSDDNRIAFSRFRGFTGAIGGGGTGSRGGLQALQGSQPPPSGLAAKLARGLVVTSESGRVISFLNVDELSQLMVSIRVLEVDRGKARKMGINFRLDSEHISIGNYTGPQTPNGMPGQLGSQPSVTPLARTGNIVAAFVDKATSILTAIDFLDSKNLIRSVAEPNILTLSGEQATVLVGGEVPIPTTAVNQVTTVQGFFFQDFGVRLDIRPTVDASGIVTLEVAPSIVKPDSGLGVGQVPGFQIQTVETTARVEAGQSLVLGGLLSFDESLEQRGLPGLQKIPLFRWKNRTHSEQELLFIITPQLMGTSSDAAQAAKLPDSLEWPEDRGEWLESMPAPEYGPDGIPPSFSNAPEPAIISPAPAPAPAPVPAPVPVTPQPAPVYQGTEPPPATDTATPPPSNATGDSPQAVAPAPAPQNGDSTSPPAAEDPGDSGSGRSSSSGAHGSS